MSGHYENNSPTVKRHENKTTIQNTVRPNSVTWGTCFFFGGELQKQDAVQSPPMNPRRYFNHASCIILSRKVLPIKGE
ncbi:MAG: hypothetical protein FWG02_05970 [Holophagaceae bacterium]|nr:hypothetical protein [Holophagaceae bacterium]